MSILAVFLFAIVISFIFIVIVVNTKVFYCRHFLLLSIIAYLFSGITSAIAILVTTLLYFPEYDKDFFCISVFRVAIGCNILFPVIWMFFRCHHSCP